MNTPQLHSIKITFYMGHCLDPGKNGGHSFKYNCCTTGKEYSQVSPLWGQGGAGVSCGRFLAGTITFAHL